MRELGRNKEVLIVVKMEFDFIRDVIKLFFNWFYGDIDCVSFIWWFKIKS